MDKLTEFCHPQFCQSAKQVGPLNLFNVENYVVIFLEIYIFYKLLQQYI